MHCLKCGKETPPGNRVCITCANLTLGFFDVKRTASNLEAEGTDLQLPIASIGRRFVALLIDSFILMMLGLVALLITLVINIEFRENLGFFEQVERFFNSTYPRIEKKFNLQVNLLTYLMILPYTAIVLFFFGVTPGKVCMRLLVVHEKSMTPASFLRSMYRELICRYFALYIMFLIGLFFSLIAANSLKLAVISGLISIILLIITSLASLVQYLLPFFNKKKKALHDYLAGTVVIKI